MASSGSASGGDEGELSQARLLDKQAPVVEEEVCSRFDGVPKRFVVALFVCLATLAVSLLVGSRGRSATTRHSHPGLQLNGENPKWKFSLVGEADHACQEVGVSVRLEEGTNFAGAMLDALWSEPNREIHAGVTSLLACKDICVKDLSCKAIEYSSNDPASCAVWHSEVSVGLQENNTACYRFSVSSDDDGEVIVNITNKNFTITQTSMTSVTTTETTTFATTTATSTTTATQTLTSTTLTTVTVDENSWFTTVDGGKGRACRGLQAESNVIVDVRRLSADGEEGSPGSGKPIIVLPWNVSSLDHCKMACIRARQCHGIEYNHDLKSCKVWANKTVMDSVEASSSTCLRFTLSGKTGEVDAPSCPEAWPKPKQPSCSKVGENCLVSGCCVDPLLSCSMKDGFWAECRATCIAGMKDVVYDEKPGEWSCDRIGCGSFPGRFVPPGGWWDPPENATAHNGAQLADVFVNKEGGHVYLIGDWGGLLWNHETADESTKRCGGGKYCAWTFVDGVDDKAQFRVRDKMVLLAQYLRPDYVLNVGDNFYWGGVEQTCLHGKLTDVWTNQFDKLYERVYKGDGLDGKQWLGVLGNHDYGGWRFDQGWDKAIGYTWHAPTSRWMTPALYYQVKVWYSNFAIDYFFMDTNVLDAMNATIKSSHNICSAKHNGLHASCAPVGPKNAWDCPYWFKNLWEEQKNWFTTVAPQSTGDWRIVVTHFPPYFMTYEWVDMAKTYEIDMIITGHRHRQHMYMMGDHVVDIWVDDPGHLKTNFIDPTSYIVTGGGGGVTSEEMPVHNGEDDQYGFMDLFATKDTLRVEAFSHTGKSRRVMYVPHTYRHNNSRDVWKERSA